MTMRTCDRAETDVRDACPKDPYPLLLSHRVINRDCRRSSEAIDCILALIENRGTDTKRRERGKFFNLSVFLYLCLYLT